MYTIPFVCYEKPEPPSKKLYESVMTFTRLVAEYNVQSTGTETLLYVPLLCAMYE